MKGHLVCGLPEDSLRQFHTHSHSSPFLCFSHFILVALSVIYSTCLTLSWVYFYFSQFAVLSFNCLFLSLLRKVLVIKKIANTSVFVCFGPYTAIPIALTVSHISQTVTGLHLFHYNIPPCTGLTHLFLGITSHLLQRNS